MSSSLFHTENDTFQLNRIHLKANLQGVKTECKSIAIEFISTLFYCWCLGTLLACKVLAITGYCWVLNNVLLTYTPGHIEVTNWVNINAFVVGNL